eukprot:jgi/Ulvmu1/5671/UM024_0018.1
MTVLTHTHGCARLSAIYAQSQHARARRSRSFSLGQPAAVAITGRSNRGKLVYSTTASAESHTASSGRDYSTWDALREEMVSVLADLDATSTVLRIESLVTIYSILLGCEGKVLADACSNIVRAPVLEVVVEAIVIGSEKQQAAALGLVAVLIMGMEDINDSILIYATFQDMIEFKQCIALSTSLCTQLLQHQEEQFRWAAMQFLFATASFPFALSYIRDSSALLTQLAQCALHPLIAGVHVPLPHSPALTDSLPRAGESLPRPRPFPSDPRSRADLVRGLAHGGCHVLALLHAFSERRGQVQAQVYATAAALMLEVQAQDVADRAPTLLTLLQSPPSAASAPPPAPAVKLAVETLRRAACAYVRSVEALFGTPVLLVALEALVQVEVHTEARREAGGLRIAEEAGKAGSAEPPPRRDPDDGSRDGLPPLTVRDSGAGGVGPGEMPEEIVQWVSQHMERNNIKLSEATSKEMPMTMTEYQELSQLMAKYNINDTKVLEGPPSPGRSSGNSSAGSMVFGMARPGEGSADSSLSSRGSMQAGAGDGARESGAEGAPWGQELSQWGGPTATAQAVVRVAVAQCGLGLGREAMLAGAAPAPAVTLASAGATKAGIASTTFLGESGDVLLAHFSGTIRGGEQQRDLDGVEMPHPGAGRSLAHVRDCLDIVEAAAKKVPAGAVDDALARELGSAFRASAAAVLGAAWSSQLAEPLHSVSPALAAAAHTAAMQRLNRRTGLRGLPDKAMDVSGLEVEAPWLCPLPGQDKPLEGAGTARPGLPQPAAEGDASARNGTGIEDRTALAEEEEEEMGADLAHIQEQLSMPLLFTQFEDEVQMPVEVLLRALQPALKLPLPLAQWPLQLLYASCIVSFPTMRRQPLDRRSHMYEAEVEGAAHMLRQLLPSTVDHLAGTSAAAQGPNALTLRFGPGLPSPRDVQWFTRAFQHYPGMAMLVSALQAMLRALRWLVERLQALGLGGRNDVSDSAPPQQAALPPASVQRSDAADDASAAPSAFERWTEPDTLANWEWCYDLLLCSLYLRAEKPQQEEEAQAGSELLLFMLTYPTYRTWANLQECAAMRQLSYDAFADFVAQAAFAGPPVTLAGFTSGSPVSRRGPMTPACSDSYLASLWATQWHTRLDSVSPFAARVPHGIGAPVADAVAGVREDNDEYSDVAPVVAPVAAGDSGAEAAVVASAEGVSPVFAAEEEVPLTAAWGVEDCAGTLAAAYGVLAVTLEERREDGAAAMALYAGSKSALRHAVEELEAAAETGLQPLRYVGAPLPHWHQPLLLLHAVARSKWPQPLLGEAAAAALMAFAGACVDRLLTARMAPTASHDDEEATDTDFGNAHIGPLPHGDALAYLTVAIDTLSALATSSSAAPASSATDADPGTAAAGGGVAAQPPPTAPPLTRSAAAPPSAPLQPLSALRGLPSLLFATIQAVGRQDVGEDEGGVTVLPRVYTTPFNRFQLIHCYAHEHALADASHEPDKQDVYASMRTDNRCAPHYLTDYVTAAAATRAALAGLDAALRSGTGEGGPGESIRDMLRKPRMLAKIRVQMAERGACSQQAVSLLASALVAEPALAAEFHAQSIPGAVMRVFKSTVDELTGELPRSFDDDDDFGALAGHHLKPAPPERVAAVCVQFFLRMAVAPSDRPATAADTPPRPAAADDGAPVDTGDAGEAPEVETDSAAAADGSDSAAGQGQLLAGAAAAGKYAASIARLPRLMVYCLKLLTEGDDAGQKLAAELLRVLVSTRQARLALRSARGDQTLVDCLNAAAPQVQQSAFEALKVLYYSEDGDRGFMVTQRAKRLGDRLVPKSHAERTTEAMRQRVYASSWPIVDTTAGPATSAADPAEHAAESDSEAGDAAQAPAKAAVQHGPQPPLPAVGEPSGEGGNEGEMLGAVGVAADGEIKLYILEALPEAALAQLEWAVPAEPAHVQACMDVAVEYARAEHIRNGAPDAAPAEAGDAATTSPDIQVLPAGQPNDMPYQPHAPADIIIGRIVLDVRDMSARCIGLAALRPEHWDAIIARVRTSEAASGLRGERGVQWLKAVQQSVLTDGDGPEAVEGAGAAAALLPAAAEAAVPIGGEPAGGELQREGAGTVAELWAGDAVPALTDEEEKLANILGLRQGEDGVARGGNRADGAAGDGTAASDRAAGAAEQGATGNGAADAGDVGKGQLVAALLASGAFSGKAIPERGVPDISDQETFAAGTAAMDALKELRDIDGMTMGRCMHELSWRSPTRCSLCAEFQRHAGDEGAWGGGASCAGPGAASLLQPAQTAPEEVLMLALADDTADGSEEVPLQPAEDEIVQEWLTEKRRETAAAVAKRPPSAALSDVLARLPVDVFEDQEESALTPGGGLKTHAARRALEDVLRLLGADALERVEYCVDKRREMIELLLQMFSDQVPQGQVTESAALVSEARDAAEMQRAQHVLLMLGGELTVSTPRHAAAVFELLRTTSAEVRAAWVHPLAESLAEAAPDEGVTPRMVAVRGGAASAVALAQLMWATEEACVAFAFHVDEIEKVMSDEEKAALADLRAQVLAARRRFNHAFEELLELPSGTLSGIDEEEGPRQAFVVALNAAPAVPSRGGRPPRQRALGAGAATLRGGSRGGAPMAGGGSGGSSSAPWMRGLNDEQVAEYFLRQRREFDQVTEMLEGRVSAREARAQRGEAVLESLSQQDREVVEEQEAVLREVARNRTQLDKQVSERLGVPAARLAGASTVAEVLGGEAPSPEPVPADSQEALEAAWELLAAVLVRPPAGQAARRASGAKQVAAYVDLLKAQGNAAAAAISEASGALDAVEASEGAEGPAVARTEALERLNDSPRRPQRHRPGALARRSKKKRDSETARRAEEYIEQLKDADANKVDQLCWELVQRIANDGSGWLKAAQSTGLDRVLFELIRAPTKPVPAAAAVFGALASNNPPGVAASLLGPRLPELVAVLASGLSARGSAADAALRYECILALVSLVTTRQDRETAGQLALARACTLLREADLEAEQRALLDLLAVLCMDSPQHSRQIMFQNILPRLQQLMAHPDRVIQRSAVSLMQLIAVNPNNEALLRRWDLHSQLAKLMRGGVGQGRGPHTTETAAMAAATAYGLVSRAYAFGRRRKGNVAAARSFAAHGVFAAATALAAGGSVACQHVALPLLHSGLQSEAADVRHHILSLGVVPLLVELAEGSGGAEKQAAARRGSTAGLDVGKLEQQIQLSAAAALEAVDGDKESMAVVGSAGTVPLRTWLLSAGPLGPHGAPGGGRDGGGSGPSRFDIPDDDDDSRGGGTPAFLF